MQISIIKRRQLLFIGPEPDGPGRAHTHKSDEYTHSSLNLLSFFTDFEVETEGKREDFWTQLRD